MKSNRIICPLLLALSLFVSGCNVNIEVAQQSPTAEITHGENASAVEFHQITEDSPSDDWEDTPHYAIITGLQEDGTEVWSIQTKTVYGVWDCGTYQEIGTNQNVFYYADIPRHAVVALDVSTGNVLWENFDFQDMWVSEVCFSPDGTVLICCEGGSFCAIRTDGTTWYQTYNISIHSKIIAVEEQSDIVIVTLCSDDWGTYNILLCDDSRVEYDETSEFTLPE